MVLIIGKGSIEEKIKKEKIVRADIRRQVDVLSGLSRAKGPQRGDYNELRKIDKILGDYRNFKNPNDREKIKNEYFASQKELRKT